MDCVLLGIGATMPLFKRPLTSAAVRLHGRIYLFDGGEGVQMVCKNVHLGFRPISVIAVSHLHADHCLGIPGILMMRARSEDPGPVTIIGPPGIERFIRDVKRDLAFYTNYEMRFVEYSEESGPMGIAYEDEAVRIRWAPMKHTVFCLGYVLEEHERPGRFDPEKAAALGLPRGPLWGALQKGEKVLLDDGRTVAPDQVLGPQRRGRSVAYLTDTMANRNMYSLLRNADLAFIEGMFLSEDEDTARDRLHLTAKEAGRLCARAETLRAVLIHISPRYENARLSLLESEARESFPAAEMGRVGSVYSVALPE